MRQSKPSTGKPALNLQPTFAEEEALRSQGLRYIAGVDEVGCGALAGPLYAAAVVLPLSVSGGWTKRVRDSKQLTPQVREELSGYIHQAAISVAAGWVSHRFIDEKGLTEARRQAMRLAIYKLCPEPQAVLIDFFRIPGMSMSQKAVKNGDSLCFSIACASIVAKVARDRLMTEMDSVYPGYGLAQHKGYYTPGHRAALRLLGPCEIHRRSFEPVRDSE